MARSTTALATTFASFTTACSWANVPFINRLQDFDHKTIELRLLLGLAAIEGARHLKKTSN